MDIIIGAILIMAMDMVMVILIMVMDMVTVMDIHIMAMEIIIMEIVITEAEELHTILEEEVRYIQIQILLVCIIEDHLPAQETLVVLHQEEVQQDHLVQVH